jgi:hypothetical protein
VSKAVVTRTKKIRFEQNSVLSISDLSESTGTSDEDKYTCTPKPLERVGHFTTGGQLHSLISLGRPWNRGEELGFTIQETLMNAFTANREDLTVNVKSPMDHLVLSVTWPDDRRVESVYIERFGKQTPVPESDRKQETDGRPWYTHSFEQLQVGESISVVWDWAEPLPGANA